MKNIENLGNKILYGIFTIGLIGFGIYLYETTKIHDEYGVYGMKNRMLTHSLLDEGEFSPENVKVKLVNGECEEIALEEVEEIKNDILANRKILDAQLPIYYGFSKDSHYIWYVKNNLWKNKTNDLNENRKIYFMDNMVCNSYVFDKDKVTEYYHNIKADQKNNGGLN